MLQRCGSRRRRAGRGPLVECVVHAEFYALAPDVGFILLPDVRVFIPVGDGAAPLVEVHRVLIEDFLSGTPRFAPGATAEWSEPGHQTQRLTPPPEMLMEVLAAHRGRTDHADGFVVLAKHLLRLARFPGARADVSRPRVGVTLACDTDQHGGGLVRVGLRVPPGFMLPDPMVEHVAGQMGFQAAESRRAAGVQRGGQAGRSRRVGPLKPRNPAGGSLELCPRPPCEEYF